VTGSSRPVLGKQKKKKKKKSIGLPFISGRLAGSHQGPIIARSRAEEKRIEGRFSVLPQRRLPALSLSLRSLECQCRAGCTRKNPRIEGARTPAALRRKGKEKTAQQHFSTGKKRKPFPAVADSSTYILLKKQPEDEKGEASRAGQ